VSPLDTSSPSTPETALEDVLDLDSAFAQAHASEQAFVRQALLDATREAIRMVDAQGNIVAQNDAATALDRDLFGFDEEDEISFNERQHRISASVQDPEAYLAALAELQGDLEFEQVIEWKHAASGRVFIRYARPVRNQGGQAIGRAFVTREITLEKENERLKDEFIALVSHELRTPLTSMIGFIDLLQDVESGPLNEEQVHFVNTLDRNTKRLLRIVGDLLFVAQSDAGRIAVSPSPQRLDPIVTHCVEEVTPSANARDLDISLTVDCQPLTNVDSERISQVVHNLLTNAIKFTEPGGSIAVRLYLEDEQACVSVTDTGMGLSPEDQQRLFTRFFRTDKATELAIQGTGLGLAICRTIVERHGGEIGVRSQEGAGSTFFVKLPVIAEDPA
jgi:signal transduction histidine kinase